MTGLGTLASAARRMAIDDTSRTAVVDGGTRWSWGELDERADAVVLGLLRFGVVRGDRIALLTDATAPAIAALHGIARIGAAAAPLWVGLTVPELSAAVEVTDPRVIVVDSRLPHAAIGLDLPTLALEDLLATVSRGGSAASLMTTDPEDAAAVVLTSGTTGRPKAAILSTAALSASAEAWLAALPRATGWLLALGLHHVAGLGVVWRAALSGVPLVVLARPRPGEIMAALADDPSPSHVSLVPTTLTRLLDAAADDPPPPSLRAVLVGGGPISPELVRRAIAAGWPVVPTYGLTEAGSGVTALPTGEADDHPGSAGWALPGIEIRIADPDPAGAGQILVQSPARFSGYLGDTAGTAATLTETGWLRTGDIGRLDDDGRLSVLDRRTDLIVRGGENISPVEVEDVLRAHPAIVDAAVVARRDPAWGQVPVAAIVLRDDIADPGDDELIRHCRDRLVAFKVPAEIVRVASLPRTDGAKLRRGEVRARLDPAPDAPARLRHLGRPGAVRIVYRSLGVGPAHLLVLHGTLSTSRQLAVLAHLLVAHEDLTVHLVDRRGSGDSRLAEPKPLDVGVHVDDLLAILDAEGCAAAALFGVSFGGVVALEFAARAPDRTLAVVAHEPPYGAVADPNTQRKFVAVRRAAKRAYLSGGPSAAAEAFLRAIGGDAAWDRLSERARGHLAEEGASAYVDTGLHGLDPAGLAGITVPVTVLTGDASEALYRPIADALVDRIPGARWVPLPAVTHASPITDPGPIAAAVRAALAAAGVVHNVADHREHEDSQA